MIIKTYAEFSETTNGIGKSLEEGCGQAGNHILSQAGKKTQVTTGDI